MGQPNLGGCLPRLGLVIDQQNANLHKRSAVGAQATLTNCATLTAYTHTVHENILPPCKHDTFLYALMYDQETYGATELAVREAQAREETSKQIEAMELEAAESAAAQAQQVG